MEGDVTPDSLIGHGDPGDWVCSRCTLINSALGLECAMCFAKRPFSRERQAMPNTLPPPPLSLFRQLTHSWACRACTFINNNADAKCTLCGTSKVGDETSALRTMERELSQARQKSTSPPGGAPIASANLGSPDPKPPPPAAVLPEKKEVVAQESKDPRPAESAVVMHEPTELEVVDGEAYLAFLKGEAQNKAEAKATQIVELWHQFAEATDVKPTVSAFERLQRATGARGLRGLALFEHMRTRICAVCPFRTQQWWQGLADKRDLPCYAKEGANRRVLVVGGSVAGLRSAVELAMLGAEVVCIELRDQFRRWNVLHIWEFCVNDLLQLGVKLFYPSFGTSEHQHIPIRVLQCHLLKVALCLGVTFVCPCNFAGLEWVPEKQQGPVSARSNYVALLDVSETPESEDDEESPNPRVLRVRLRVDAVLGCDGTKSAVADACEFVRKSSRGSLAIGLTANFVNEGTPEENKLPQLQHAYQYNRAYFNSLEETVGVQCENLVYFRCPTNHYFVLTPSLTSLLNVGVLKEKLAFPECLSRGNLDQEKLLAVARQVSEFCGVPRGRPFCPFGADDKPDVALFDFSQRTVASDAMLFLRGPGRAPLTSGLQEPAADAQALLQLKANEASPEEAPLLVQLVGDSLMEPFWPQGTGANRAVLGALDCAWSLKQWWAGQTAMQDILAGRADAFAQMRLSEPNSLIDPSASRRRASSVSQKNFSELDPKLRYKSNVM